MSEHTPGPWTISQGDLGILRLTARPSEMGRTLHLASFAEATDADARLIAAAPDLLAALENIAWPEAVFSDWFMEAQKQARAAIAKAKGEA